GSVAARRAVRQEIDELRSLLRERQNGAPVAEPRPAAPAPPAADAVVVAAAEPVAAAPVVDEGISPEILMVLSAAVAAFLGKRARIRRASIMPAPGASAWAQQGRVFVQASHNLSVHHR